MLLQAATNGCGHRKAKENQRPKDNVWLHLAHSAAYVRASSPTKSSNRVGVVFSGVRRGLIIPSLKARVISTYNSFEPASIDHVQDLPLLWPWPKGDHFAATFPNRIQIGGAKDRIAEFFDL